jgi:hypothetical protein
MISCINVRFGLPECRQFASPYLRKSLKEKHIAKGMPSAIRRAPVMYRLLGKSCQPNEKQRSGKSNRQRSGPPNGMTGG